MRLIISTNEDMEFVFKHEHPALCADLSISREFRAFIKAAKMLHISFFFDKMGERNMC
jgi:hypothetical protein